MSETTSPFTEACERCGTFAPLTRSFDVALCAECVRKSVHEIARTPLDFVHAWKGLFQILVRVGLPAVALGIALELPHAVTARFVTIPPLLDLAWGQLTVAYSDLVAIQLAWQVVRGRKVLDFGGAARAAFEAFGRVFLTRLLASLQVLLYSLALVVPGVVRALSLFLVTPVAAFEPSDGGVALARSTRLMRGHRWLALGVSLLALIPFLSVLVSAGVAIVAVAITTNSVEPPTSPVVDFVSDVLSPVLVLPLALLPVVFYAKLAPPAPDLR